MSATRNVVAQLPTAFGGRSCCPHNSVRAYAMALHNTRLSVLHGQSPYWEIS